MLDIMLPGIDGWEVARRLRANPATAAVPLVIASILEPSAEPGDPDDPLSVEANAFLAKPFTARQVETVIDRIVGSPAAPTTARTENDSEGKPMNRVLVVDDDADIRELVTFKLQQAGYAVEAAADGQLGLDAALANTPELILLDLMMPKLSGIEVCRLLRDNDATADTPVILFTAKAQEADVQRGFLAGADDYIVKPFSPRELITRVQAVLARARSH
jgi:Response regulators consisting of a CheY-like receiver domain and a winged-helix DNA-binding domain